MQVFEVVELDEYPFMMTEEIHTGNIVKDVIKEDKVYLIVDHNLNRIWIYNGYKSTFKLQAFAIKLGDMLRAQLQLKYTVFTLNRYSQDHKTYKEIMGKNIGGGVAQSLETSDFLGMGDKSHLIKADVQIIPDIKVNDAIEYINEIPPPENFFRKFMLIGGNIYTDEEITEKFVTEEETIQKPLKLGRLNRGFTFFRGNYSTRLIIHDRKVQGIELYIHEKDKSEIQSLEVNIPIFPEEKYSKPGSVDSLMNAFQIPDELPEED